MARIDADEYFTEGNQGNEALLGFRQQRQK
jgi:hypothetical protein